MKSFLILSFALAGSAVAAEGDVNKRLDALEMASYANTLSWSGFMESRFDSMTYKSEGVPDAHYNLHRLLVGLDFKAIPSEKLSLFGRVSMGKFFNNDSPGIKTSLSSSRRYAGNDQPNLERIFMNYTPFQSLTLSIGRLPTFDGPPHHIYDGASRRGSYPAQLYTAALDGYAVTYSPSIGESHSLSFRAILSPLSYITPAPAAGTQWKYFEKDTVPAGAGVAPRRDEVKDITSWMVDYTWTGSSIARNINVVYQGLSLKNLQLTSTLGFDYMKHVLYLELNDIASMGLTAYVSAAQVNVGSQGGQIVGLDANSQPIVVSVLANEPDSSEKSLGTVMGLYYALPVAALNKAALGFELIKGSEFYQNFDLGSDEPFGMYDLRGTGSHVYYTQPLTHGLVLRIGMEQAKADYTNGLLGKPMPSNDKMSSIYAHVRADF